MARTKKIKLEANVRNGCLYIEPTKFNRSQMFEGSTIRSFIVSEFRNGANVVITVERKEDAS